MSFLEGETAISSLAHVYPAQEGGVSKASNSPYRTEPLMSKIRTNEGLADGNSVAALAHYDFSNTVTVDIHGSHTRNGQ